MYIKINAFKSTILLKKYETKKNTKRILFKMFGELFYRKC